VTAADQPAHSVIAPTAGIDGRVALATSMHAAPGVYAVLVGSGMSSAAGVPTGWQVVQDLIRKVGIAEGVDPSDIGDTPEEWWAGLGRPEPQYDTILPALASTDAARQSLLRTYFDPPPEAGGPILPTVGHNALAELCRSGRVKLILTTNFDRLIERALDAVGITPQVISSSAAIAGMTPLPHAPVTVLKVHGDYAMPGLRNTPEELRTYDPEWDRLLDRIFDEYGLLTIGWSAEYDTALADALSRCPSRRYPMFWAAHEGTLTEGARRLIGSRGAAVVDVKGADEFFVDLQQRISRLDEIAARRQRPTPLRNAIFQPDPTSAPQGWGVLPLLQLRAVAAVSPVTLDTVGLIRPQHRDALVSALRAAAATMAVRSIGSNPPASAAAPPVSPATAEPLVDWSHTPHAHQSTDYASYRLGGDASGGVSSLVTVQCPNYANSGSVLFKIDIGVSIERALWLGETVRALRDALVLVTSVLPGVFAEILPTDAEVQQAEIHLLAPSVDGNNKNRPNDLLQRVDLALFGTPTRTVGPLLAFATQLSGPLTEHEAAEVVATGFDYMTLASGYLDTRVGMGSVRYELGLPASV